MRALIGMGLAVALAACVPSSPEEAEVARAAREWANREGAVVATDFSNVLMAEFTVMRGADEAAIRAEIRRVLAWSFSLPTEGDHKDQYKVVATARARPTLAPPSMPMRSYDISAEYELTVDARGRGVISYRLDLSQVSVKDRTSFVEEP